MLFVIGVGKWADGANDNNNPAPERCSLLALGRAPLIAGTPKMLRALYNAAVVRGVSGRGARSGERGRTCWSRRG